MRQLEKYLPAGLAALFTLLGVAELAWPQSASTSPSLNGGTGYAVVTFGLVVGLLVVVGAAVKLYDLKRKREDESIALQARLSDVFLSDPRLTALPVAVTVHVPLSQRGSTLITLAGTVPSPELREIAILVTEREAASMRRSYRIEDRLHVDPLMARRAA